MPLKKDLSGEKFGLLTAIKIVGKKRGKMLWLCKCECGRQTSVMIDQLTCGHTKSCGCLKHKIGQKLMINLTGNHFERLTVLKHIGTTRNRHMTWLCSCKCGRKIVVSGKELRNGSTKSCGCLQKDRVVQKNTKHGFAVRRSRNRLYGIWTDMKKRCNNPNHMAFKHYGGRGIIVCPEWNESFKSFYSDMSESHDTHLQQWGVLNTTLDRIDNDSEYSLNNCRWATRKTQSNNRGRRLL